MDGFESGLNPVDLWWTWFNKTPDSAVVTDVDLYDPGGPQILAANEAFQVLSGLPAQTIIGKRLNFFYRSKMLPRMIDQMRDALAGRVVPEIEVPAEGTRKRTVWVTVRLIPVFAADGRPQAVIRIIRDITTQKRAEQGRTAAEHLLASLFGLVEQGLAVVNEGGRIVMANAPFGRQLGRPLADLIGLPFRKILDEDVINPAPLSTKRSVRLAARDGSTRTANMVPVSVDRQDDRGHALVAIPFDAPPPQRPEADLPLDAVLRDRIATAKQSPSTIVAGRLQLVGLEEVQAALGPKWPSVAPRAFATAESILRRMLGSCDVFARTADDAFLICFAELDSEAARFKAEAIRKEILTCLIGEHSGFENARIVAHVAEVPMHRAEAEQETDLSVLLERRLQEEARRHEQDFRQSLRTEIAAHAIRLQPVVSDAGKATPLVVSRLPDKVEARVLSLSPDRDSDVEADVELLHLSAVAELLLGSTMPSGNELVLVPVRMATLLHRRDAEPWLRVARGLGEIGRRRIVMEIRGAPKGTRLDPIVKAIGISAPLFRALALELPDFDPSPLADLPAAVTFLTMSARQILTARASGHSVARLLRSQTLRNRRFIAKEVATQAEASALREAGLQFLAEPLEPDAFASNRSRG